MSIMANELPSPPPSPSHDYLDDVFTSAADGTSNTEDPSLHPSSITKVQRVHYNNGYREGISTSKGAHVQDGFDEGYTLGAEFALQAGVLLGALQQLCQDLEGSLRTVKAGHEEVVDMPGTESGRDGGQGSTGEQRGSDNVRSMLLQAEEELNLQSIFGKEYFDENGIWTWEPQGTATEAAEHKDTTAGQDSSHKPPDSEDAAAPVPSVRAIAQTHPLLVQWHEHLRELFRYHGLTEAGLSWGDTMADDEPTTQDRSTV